MTPKLTARIRVCPVDTNTFSWWRIEWPDDPSDVSFLDYDDDDEEISVEERNAVSFNRHCEKHDFRLLEHDSDYESDPEEDIDPEEVVFGNKTNLEDEVEKEHIIKVEVKKHKHLDRQAKKQRRFVKLYDERKNRSKERSSIMLSQERRTRSRCKRTSRKNKDKKSSLRRHESSYSTRRGENCVEYGSNHRQLKPSSTSFTQSTQIYTDRERL